MKRKLYAALPIWGHDGVCIQQLVEPGVWAEQSVAVFRSKAGDLANALRDVFVQGGTYDFGWGRVALRATRDGVHMSDFQGRKLFVPKTDLATVRELLQPPTHHVVAIDFKGHNAHMGIVVTVKDRDAQPGANDFRIARHLALSLVADSLGLKWEQVYHLKTSEGVNVKHGG